MAIRSQILTSPGNRYVVLSGRETLRHAFHLLKVEGAAHQPWWQVVVHRSDGSWAAARVEDLLKPVRERSEILDLPLDRLDLLTAVEAVDRATTESYAALALARQSPARLVVVTDGSELAGAVLAPALRDGTVHGSQLEELIDSVCAAHEVRYTDVSCPSKVAQDTARFSVTVQLRRDRPTLSAGEQRLEVRAGERVRVGIRADAFEVLNEPHQEMSVPPGEDSSPAVFHLRPRELGRHPITLDFFQGGDHLATVNLAVEVAGADSAETQAVAAPQRLLREPGISAPDIILLVHREPRDNSLTLSLIRSGGSSWLDFQALRFELEPEQFAGDSLRDLQHASQQAQGLNTSTGGSAAAERRLKKLGQNLWRDLVPEDLKSLYARERAEWRDSSLLILSDEPHLPWEMIWPYGEDWEDEVPWCLSLRLSRWLRRDTQGNGNASSPGRLPLTALACLAPRDSGLPAARQERDFLRELASRQGIGDISPAVASLEAVEDLLEAGSYDWLHVAAHGTFHAPNPDQAAALWLEDERFLTPGDLVGPAIERSLRGTRPAFFFNACHAGRLGWGLTRLGGWANRLLSCGAGLFLGPMWPVRDDAALDMARTFYAEILAGETLAEACRRARCAARREGDSSWLAYSLYAHPNAVVGPRLPT